MIRATNFNDKKFSKLLVCQKSSAFPRAPNCSSASSKPSPWPHRLKLSRVAELISMIYALAEKELLSAEITTDANEKNSREEDETPLSSEKLMVQIREAYSQNEKLWQVIKAKEAGEKAMKRR